MRLREDSTTQKEQATLRLDGHTVRVAFQPLAGLALA